MIPSESILLVSTVASWETNHVKLLSAGNWARTHSTVSVGFLQPYLEIEGGGGEVSLWDVNQEESSLLGNFDLEEYSSWLGSRSNEGPNLITDIGFGDLPLPQVQSTWIH